MSSEGACVVLHGRLWLTVDSVVGLPHDRNAANLELKVAIDGTSYKTAPCKGSLTSAAHWNEHFPFDINLPSTTTVSFTLEDRQSSWIKVNRIADYQCPLSALVVSGGGIDGAVLRCKLDMIDVNDRRRSVGVLHIGVRWQKTSRTKSHTKSMEYPVAAPIPSPPISRSTPATLYPITYTNNTDTTPPLSPALSEPQSPPPAYDDISASPMISPAALADAIEPITFRLRHRHSGLYAQPTIPSSPYERIYLILTTNTARSPNGSGSGSRSAGSISWSDSALIHTASHCAIQPITTSPTSPTAVMICRERYRGDEEGGLSTADVKFSLNGNHFVHCASGLLLSVQRPNVAHMDYTDAILVLSDVNDENSEWTCDVG